MDPPPPRAAGELTFELVRPPNRRYTFRSRLLEATTQLIVLTHDIFPSTPLRYEGQEVMAAGYQAVWFLFKYRPFDVGRFYRPDGSWTGFYVDILQPVTWQDSDPHTLQPIVDLFLDMWITPDGRYMVLDEDEFQEAIHHGHLSDQQAAQARSVLEELIRLTQSGEFPPAVAKEFRLINGPVAERRKEKPTREYHGTKDEEKLGRKRNG